MNNKIKWIALQPLTGGMYLGAEEAIGHPAEFILSYPGLDEIKYKKDGTIGGVANEAYLLKYLDKVNRKVPYYVFNRSTFDSNINDMDPEITLEGKPAKPDYSDIDIAVAVPVCSGLSVVTSAKDDTKAERNNNMIYLAKYTLNVIKPKIYIFENAPTLMGARGDSLRKYFENLAEETGYTIAYYKTDTCKHFNCQKRPRTFVMFVQKIDGENKVPVLEFVDNSIKTKDFFAQIPKGLENEDECKTQPYNYMILDFYKQKYGDSWMEKESGSLLRSLIDKGLMPELIEFMKTYPGMDEECKAKAKKYFDHVLHKISLGLNWYGLDIVYHNKDYYPSVQFRSISCTLHPSGKRLCTVREYLELMGMPHDFEWFGDPANLSKIGQNVPLKTAKFITEQAVKIINDWSNENRMDGSAVFFNNTNEQIKLIA